MTKRTIGILSCELREAGDAELCRTGTADEYGQLDRMLIESADHHVEYRDVIVGQNPLTEELVREHRLVKVIARRDDEMIKVEMDVDGLDEDERQIRLAREDDYEDAMDYATESIDDMEMNREDENDQLMESINWAPGPKWDLLREETTEVFYEDGEIVVEEHIFSAPVFPHRAHRALKVTGAAKNVEYRILKGQMTQGQLYAFLDKANPLSACARDAKRAIAKNPDVRPFWVKRYQHMVRLGAKDTVPGKLVSHLWEIIKQRDFLAAKAEVSMTENTRTQEEEAALKESAELADKRDAEYFKRLEEEQQDLNQRDIDDMKD